MTYSIVKDVPPPRKFQTHSAARVRALHDPEARARTKKTAELDHLLHTEVGQLLEPVARPLAQNGAVDDALMLIYEAQITAQIIKRVLRERRLALIESLPFTPGDFLANRIHIPVTDCQQFKQWCKQHKHRPGSGERRERLARMFCTEVGWNFDEVR